MNFVALFQTAQDRDGVFDSRFTDVNLLEATFECRVFLDVFLVFGECGRADAAQLTTRERRLQHVRCIDRAFGSARANECVQLVDKQNYLALRVLNLFQNGFQTIFKLTTILRTGKHRAEIECDEFLVTQCLRHVTGDDALCKTFDDRCLTDARFANQYGIVLGPARKDLDRATNLVVTTDDGIQFSFACGFGQVARVFRKRLVVLFGVLIRDPCAAAHLLDYFEQIVSRDAMLTQDFARIAVFLFNDRQQQVLSRDKLVLHLVSLLLRHCKELRDARAEILLPALYTWKTSHGRLRVIKNDRDVGAELPEYWSNDTFRLFEHHDEQMLGLNLLVLVPFRQLDSGLDCFLSA